MALTLSLPIVVNAVSIRVPLHFFPPVCPLPQFFSLWHSQTHFMCPLAFILWEVMDGQGDNVKNSGHKGRLRQNNCSSTLVLTLLTTTGKYNIT